MILFKLKCESKHRHKENKAKMPTTTMHTIQTPFSRTAQHKHKRNETTEQLDWRYRNSFSFFCIRGFHSQCPMG